jgi:hypothetical protein
MLPIKSTAWQRLETYANVSRIQTDEETYDHSNPDMAAVPDRPATDRHRLGGAGSRSVVPVDVGDRETDDMELTLLERWDDSHTETMRWKPEEIRRAIAIAQAVEEHTMYYGEDTIAWIKRRADELLEGK